MLYRQTYRSLLNSADDKRTRICAFIAIRFEFICPRRDGGEVIDIEIYSRRCLDGDVLRVFLHIVMNM